MPDPSDPLDKLLIPLLATRGEQHLLRQLKTLRPIDAVHVLDDDGTRFVNFSSNNYLGLSHHPRVIEAVGRAAREFGAGAVASPLITGHTAAHASAEAAVARWKSTEASLLLPSGYQANHAVVQTIQSVAEAAGRRVRFLLDKLVHASLIDAVRGSGSPMRVFAHNDLAKLERLLASPGGDDEMQVVVTESIFSMDGDAAPLREIAAMKKKTHVFTLVVDEAHGSGVYGEGGAGYAAEVGVMRDVDVFVVTLSKALGLAGGAICGTKNFCDAVVNFGRAFIYSTATPPMLAAGCEAAIAVMRDEPQRQRRVRELASRVRRELKLPLGDSPIVPIVLGEERAALEAAEQLRRDAMLVLAVRPPTVPKGTSRLRVTLSSAHSDAEVDRLVASLSNLRK